MHIWEGISVREEQWRRVTDKVITIEQAYAVTTIQALTRERLAVNTSNFKMSLSR